MDKDTIKLIKGTLSVITGVGTIFIIAVVWLFFLGELTVDDYSTERSYAEYGDYDCSDFSSQAEAQAFFEAEGGTAYDYHGLDRDKDGRACESI